MEKQSKSKNQPIRIALAKGRVARQAIKVLENLGYVFPDYSKESRKLVFRDKDDQLAFFLVKSPDVPTYVENGTADIGIVGRDILLEHPADVYELLNLDFGRCKMCVAGFEDLDISFNKKLTVATKYPNIAKTYFDSIDQPAEYIYLGGSVELAPVLGMSDCIVDIVETGTTLKENKLVVERDILDISSRLIANKVSLKTKKDKITPIINRFEQELKNENNKKSSSK